MINSTFRRASSAIAEEQHNMVRQKHANHFCIIDASLENSGNSGGMLSSRNPNGYGAVQVNYRNETQRLQEEPAGRSMDASSSSKVHRKSPAFLLTPGFKTRFGSISRNSGQPLRRMPTGNTIFQQSGSLNLIAMYRQADACRSPSRSELRPIPMLVVAGDRLPDLRSEHLDRQVVRHRVVRHQDHPDHEDRLRRPDGPCDW